MTLRRLQTTEGQISQWPPVVQRRASNFPSWTGTCASAAAFWLSTVRRPPQTPRRPPAPRLGPRHDATRGSPGNGGAGEGESAICLAIPEAPCYAKEFFFIFLWQMADFLVLFDRPVW